MKNKVARWLKSPACAFAVLYAAMLVFHLCLTDIRGDAGHYGNLLAHPLDFAALVAEMKLEYADWSSRVLINGLVCIFATAPVIVWRLLNPVVVALLAWLIAYAVRQERSTSGSRLICMLVFLYQWHYLTSAGWVVTTVTYLWALLFGLAGLMGVFRTLRGQTVSGWHWVLYSVPLVLGCNMEQAAILIAALLLMGAAMIAVRDKKLPAGLWAQLGLAAASMLFIFTCPGNALRTQVDIFSFYLDYPMLSLLKKIEIGVSGAIAPNVYGRDSLFYLFALLSALALWKKKASLPARLIGLLPCLLLLPLSLFRYQMQQVVPQLTAITDAYNGRGYITFTNSGALMSYLPMLLGYGLFALCLLNVLAAFGVSRASVQVWGIMALGGMTQAAIGFTPGAGVSSGRTGMFFSFWIVAACGILWRELGEKPLYNRVWNIVFSMACAGLCLIQSYSLYQMCL